MSCRTALSASRPIRPIPLIPTCTDVALWLPSGPQLARRIAPSSFVAFATVLEIVPYFRTLV